MLCAGVTFVKKTSLLVARIVSFDTAVLHVLTFPILEPYPSRDIELDPSHVISHYGRYYSSLQLIPSNLVRINDSKFPSCQNKYDGNIVITERFFKAMLWWKCGHLQIVLYEVEVHHSLSNKINIKLKKLKSFVNRKI